MIPKQSPAVDPLTPVAPSLTEPMPTPAAGAGAGAPPLRCIQRPTGEWFTFAAANAPGKDTPDATDLLTEAEARQRLAAGGLDAAGIEVQLAEARANPEITGDELPLPDPPIVGTSTAGSE